MTIGVCLGCEELVDLDACKIISQQGRTFHVLDRNGKGRSHTLVLKKEIKEVAPEPAPIQEESAAAKYIRLLAKQEARIAKEKEDNG